MTKLRAFTTGVALVALAACQDTTVPLPEGPQFSATAAQGVGYIVVFRDNVADVRGAATELARANGVAVQHLYQHALRGFSAPLSAAAAGRIAADPRVAYVEADGMASIFQGKGGGKPGGGGCDAEPAQVTPWGITRVGGPAGGSGTTAWVIDTGIDLDHCDLNVDVARSANFVTRGKNSPDDGNGHGTHVAGTIAAVDNTIDVVGVAAGAAVVAVRVLDNSGSGAISWVVAGVDYVAANAAAGNVANMSLGASGHFQSLHDAVLNAADQGVKFSIAAGNSSADANNFEPAHVEHANVVTISAIDINDVFASFSNFGNPPIDWAAPGVGVLSTQRGGGTTTFSGTSMAAPHVAGILLLGALRADGFAIGDPDGNPDPIAHR